MANAPRFFSTSKGIEAISFNGFEYRFAKTVDFGLSKYWRCVKKRCPGSLKTDIDGSNFVISNGNHNHIADPHLNCVRLVAQAERAESELTPLPQIYKQEVGKLAGNAAAAQMPTYLQIQSGMHKRRHKQYPPLPPTRNAIVFPQNMTLTKDNRNFLLHATPGNDILIFATTGTLTFFAEL